MVKLKKVKEIPVTGLKGPHNLDLSADGRRLWIRNHPSKSTDTGHVVMMDIATGQVLTSLAVGKSHGGIDLNSNQSNIISTNIGGHTFDVIDPNGVTVIKKIEVGAGPHGIRYSADGRWAYVAATRDNEVAVIDMKTQEVVETIKTKRKFPFWITLQNND